MVVSKEFARRRSLDAFADRMEKLLDDIEDTANVMIREAGIVTDQVAVIGTPFDLGRARANWIVTIASPAITANNPNDKTGASALEQARLIISTFKAFKLGTSLFITNNVEYIVLLDGGSSVQAPAGMVDLALQAGIARIRKTRFL